MAQVLPPLPSAARLPSLTGLRFVAAFAVFASHAYFALWFDGTWENNTPATVALITARSGVGFFFLLSGFVLAWSARPGDTAPAFWRRRAAKIYPTHLVTWFGALVLINWTGGQVAARQALPNLALIQAWWPVFDVYDSVNGVSWSLSCEAFFYLCFPLLIHLVRRIPARQLWLWAAGTAATVILLPLAATAAFASEPRFFAFPVSLHQYWFVYTFPLTRLLEFVLGMLLARAVLEGVRVGVRFRHALPALALGYPLAVQVPFLYAISAVLVVPMALLVLAGAGADIRGSRSWVRTRPMVWLGDVSFAFYMVHMLVLQYGYRLIDENHDASRTVRAGAVVLLFAAALLTAWATYALIERPVTRRLGSGRPPRSGGTQRTTARRADGDRVAP
ncbi:acyltransferase family protein [Streptomyces sp. NEAU-Y11]|uniref:acyltransferase family protein n=1 Tax=Streptomyces cucumeris TaxID=2962890 RepID=UPI0020C8FE33|nr:acyltransferase [Streptomyces sp. NEAU-Y11]MCP9206649.1 acyltransferase [Streptomyces sp. NEAU-Y11]